MTDILTTTLAAYALNLLHGAKLADFERANVVELCALAGVSVTENHLMMETNLVVANAAKEDELQRLRAAVIEKQKPWWRRWV